MSKQLTIADYYCKGCKMPAGVDDNGLCEFCRRQRLELVRDLYGDEPLPLRVHVVIVLALIVLIIGIVLALRA